MTDRVLRNVASDGRARREGAKLVWRGWAVLPPNSQKAEFTWQ